MDVYLYWKSNSFQMKSFFIIISILLSFNLNAQEDNKISTYYFIRHAEKDRSDDSNQNPHLTQKGKDRAQYWNQVLSNIKFDAIYSTDYFRTKETALPTAAKNSLELTIYNPNEININQFLKDTKGKKVLIVGHSNTTPKFVNVILGNDTYEMIADDNNANLYIITVTTSEVSSQLLFIEPQMVNSF